MRRTLALFGKPPVPGRVKTRLHDVLTPEQAAALYGAFLVDIASRPRPRGIAVELVIEPPFDEAALRDLVGPDLPIRAQRGDDLAGRLAAVFDEGLAGDHLLAVRNTDSPLLPVERERDAFAALEGGAEIVLGPDLGGGYYLVGLSRPFPSLFRDAEMSVPSNYEQTLARARELSARVVELDAEPDVDDGADLRRLCRALARPEAGAFAPRTRRVVEELRALGVSGLEEADG